MTPEEESAKLRADIDGLSFYTKRYKRFVADAKRRGIQVMGRDHKLLRRLADLVVEMTAAGFSLDRVEHFYATSSFARVIVDERRKARAHGKPPRKKPVRKVVSLASARKRKRKPRPEPMGTTL